MYLDAHDGGIVQFGETYYLYGTSYDCGFQFGVAGTRFCGVNMYQSLDLKQWTLLGPAFDPNGANWQQLCTPGGCFRPHVVYDAHVHGYVMWINCFTGQYLVLTSPTPTGPWALQPDAGTVSESSGDENLFVDDDGTAYLVRTDLAGAKVTTRSHELVVEMLDSTYLHVIAATSARPNVGFVEAPTMWKDNGRYYLAYSDPACPYCTGAGTSVLEAAKPLGPWQAPYTISAKSCAGQPTHVSPLVTSVGRIDLYQSDQWVLRPGETITRNQAAARQTWASLSYDTTGRVLPIQCP